MSSTTRTRAVIFAAYSTQEFELRARIADEPMHGLEEPVHRNRLGDIRLAAAGPDALLVALHRKRRYGDDGDGAQIVVLLQPLGDLEARDLRELDVHEDERRPMLRASSRASSPL